MNTDIYLFEQVVGALFEKLGQRMNYHLHGPGNNQVTFFLKGREMIYFIEYKKKVAAYHIDQLAEANKSDHPVLVFAEQIVPTAREHLRKKGIAYLEANGNAYINDDQITIFIDGNKPVKETKPVINRAFTKTGLKVLFHLLNDPKAINKTYRQLAQETAVGLGNITYIIEGLQKTGFTLPLEKRKLALKNKKQLLERWLAGYRETLKPDLLRGTFRMQNKHLRDNWQDIDIRALEAQWGGEPAGEIMTAYLQADKLTLYTGTLKIVTALSLIPTEKGDVQLYEKFWHQEGEVQPTAPALLVYADLLITDDPRCIETANLIYKKYLKEKFETD